MFVDLARTGTLTIDHVYDAIARGIDVDTESPEDRMTALQYVVSHPTYYNATPGVHVVAVPRPYIVGGQYVLDNSDHYRYDHDFSDGGIARYLLIHGADPNKQTGPHARAAVHYAASASTDNLLRLLHYGGDVNLQDGEGNTPVHLLVKNPSLQQQILMLKFIASSTIVNFTIRNNAGRTALEQAEYEGRMQYANLLQYVSDAYDPLLALYTAAAEGVLSKLMVEQAVAMGNPIDAVKDDDTILGIVVSDWEHGDKYEDQPDADSVVVALLQAGAAADNAACAHPPFVVAAQCGYANNLRRMIEYGVDVNVVDHRGNTALMALAVAPEHPLECLQELAKAPEIDYTLRNHRGEKAEDVAHAKGQPELAEVIKVYREQQERWSRERATWLDVTSSSYTHDLAERLLWDKYHNQQAQRPRK